MGNQGSPTLKNPLPMAKTWNPTWTSSTLDEGHATIPSPHWSFMVQSEFAEPEASGENLAPVERELPPAQNVAAKNSDITVARFIVERFVPEHLAPMGSAGRDYFQAILKHVLTPELVNRTFHAERENPRSRLKAIPDWPYLDSQPLCDVGPDHIQQIISAALSQGYSIQTATHIRNVIRKVFSHARKVLCFDGENPASAVVLPSMAHKPTRALTVDQLQLLIRNMRSPERDVSLLGLLTGMSVAEIFGLQWKYVNLSEVRRFTEEEWISPRVIAVRKQSYRSQIRTVTGSRKRDLPVGDLTARIFQSIKTRKKIANREAFVFSSRNGTPINQDNIASRRLKLIGKRLGMPWLSWNVFHRTGVTLGPAFQKLLEEELKTWLLPAATRPERHISSTAGL